MLTLREDRNHKLCSLSQDENSIFGSSDELLKTTTIDEDQHAYIFQQVQKALLFCLVFRSSVLSSSLGINEMDVS